MMKRPFLLLLALLAGPLAHAEWLTLTGSAGEATNSYVQVDPTSVVVDGSKRLVAVRISLAEPRTSQEGIKFRSVTAQASVDCDARKARYVSATYFGQPNFVGPPLAVREFDETDVRPMKFDGLPGDLAARTVNAACGVGVK
ncbi:surface-adhesin E family protein [Variovorax sp. OV700]|uniref:surface-adhesin E family protein n=1 Tax=Variovorax sp. OV700 TaxID=1882826 RepID=UPI0020C90379|nr:surface-adhesin E family protein [Variovorax sp. OV700]